MVAAVAATFSDGFARYTIGQRKGVPGGAQAPRFVVAIRPESREVVLGGLDDLDGHRVTLDEVNWLDAPLARGDECLVQLRYRAPAVPAAFPSSPPSRA